MEYCLAVENGRIEVIEADLKLLEKLNGTTDELDGWQLKEFAINVGYETIIVAYKAEKNKYSHLLSRNNPFISLEADSTYLFSDNQWLVGEYRAITDISLDDFIDTLGELLDIEGIQVYKELYSYGGKSLEDKISEYNNILFPSTAYIFGSKGSTIQSLNWSDAKHYQEEIKKYLALIRTDDYLFQTISNDSAFDTKSLITNARRLEREKIKWTVGNPIISEANLPIVNLVFSGYNLDGLGRLVNSFGHSTATDDWEEYEEGGNSSQFYNYTWDMVEIMDNGFKEVIDALSPSCNEPYTSLVLTFNIESILTEWKPTSEYIIELSKEIDDVAIAKYSMRDNHSNQWEDIFLGFIFKRLFGYFPDSILIQLNEVIF